MAQIILVARHANLEDGACGYYPSRPLRLSLDLAFDDAQASGMGCYGAGRP